MILYKVADPHEADLLKPIFTENAVPFDTAILRQFLREPTCQLYLAIEDEVVIAYAYAHLQLHPDGRVTQFINNLFVSKTHRRRGIATELLGFALDDAAEIGCHESLMSADPLNGGVRRLMKKFPHDTTDERQFSIKLR